MINRHLAYVHSYCLSNLLIVKNTGAFSTGSEGAVGVIIFLLLNNKFKSERFGLW